jgi:hypothetical protein
LLRAAIWLALSYWIWHAGPAVLGPAAMLISLALVAVCLVQLAGWGSDFGRKLRIRRDFLPRCRQALEDGRAEVERISARGVVQVGATAEDRPTFFFDVGDGQVFYYGEPDVGPVDEDAAWPNSEFELVHTERDRLWLGLSTSGHALAPQRRIDPEAIDWDALPEEQELFPARLATLEEDLRRWAEARAAAGGEVKTEDAAQVEGSEVRGGAER